MKKLNLILIFLLLGTCTLFAQEEATEIEEETEKWEERTKPSDDIRACIEFSV